MANRNVKAAVGRTEKKLPYNYSLTMGELEQIMEVAQEWGGGKGTADIISAINTAFKFGVSVGSRAHAAGRIPAL